MKNKFILFLVLLLSFNLSSTFGQRSDNDYRIDINKSVSSDSIEIENTYKLRLDSLVGKSGENFFKVCWKYEKNKITEEYFKKVDNNYRPEEKTISIYNERDLIIQELKYTWNEESGSYQPNTVMNGSKTEFIYDDNGNKLFQYQYFWSTDKETFLPYDKEEFKYDAQGREILRLWYTWNSKSERFDINSKNEYKYDSQGNIIESNWYTYKSHYNDYRDDFFLETSYKFTYSLSLDAQYMQLYNWDKDLRKMQLHKKSEVRYSIMENKKISPKHYYWANEQLKNKYKKISVIYAPNFIVFCENDISNSKISSDREFRYDKFGMCILYNKFSVNKVTNERYKSNVRSRKLLVDDKLNLIYSYTDSDYDLDFNKWEIDREWVEYYTKIEK